MSSKRILAFSSSREGKSAFLEKAVPAITEFLGSKSLHIAFIPFASVTRHYESYMAMVKEAFAGTTYDFSCVMPGNAKAVIEKADVIMTGGGNTFKLLHDIYEYKLLDLIREKVTAGTPYIGWSAGSNITGPGIGTTNDMPIIEPKSFNALGLFPFQINPHYYNVQPEGFNGETRDQRLTEFTIMNPGITIACLPEGTALKFDSGKLVLIGSTAATLFYFENEDKALQRSIQVGEDISYLM